MNLEKQLSTRENKGERQKSSLEKVLNFAF